MIAKKQDLITKELEEGTGAAISVAIDDSGLRSGLRIWFGDLQPKEGPVAELRPYGLKAHRVELSFGNFAAPIIAQIRRASEEDIQLARALVSSVRSDIIIDIGGQSSDSWLVSDGRFHITATIRHEGQPDEDEAISTTCREVIVPLMAAMAELIGYDVLEDDILDDTPAYEGAILQSLVKRRERNPRNRLLCIRIHGEKCACCEIEPGKSYGSAGGIIEVHHLEPLASISAPRPYDPRTDLVPLCPNCHRAVHTRRPAPLSIDELRSILGKSDA